MAYRPIWPEHSSERDCRGRVRPSIALVAVLCVASPGCLWCFEGNEHKKISDLALLLAYECLRSETNSKLCTAGIWSPTSLSEGTRAAMSLLPAKSPIPPSENSPPAPLSYGDFVKFVDFVDDPTKLLRPNLSEQDVDKRGDSVSTGCSFGWKQSESERQRFDGWICGSPVGEEDLDKSYLVRIEKRATGKLQALHTNTSHFQDHLVYSIWSWHRNAREEAFLAGRDSLRAGDAGIERGPVEMRARHSLYLALLDSAVASHFIEDSFAPGHIVAPRDGFPDYSASTIHDRYNNTGAFFVMSAEDQVRFFNYFEGLFGVLLEHGEILQRLGIDEGEAWRYFCELAGNSAQSCNSGSPVDARGTERLFLFRGDGDLFSPSGFGVLPDRCDDGRSPSRKATTADWNCEEASNRQRLLVLLYVARSIIEVFDAYALGSTSSSDAARDVDMDAHLLENYAWRRMKVLVPSFWHNESVELPTAETAVGHFSRGGVVALDGMSGESKEIWERGDVLKEVPSRGAKIRYGFMSNFEIGSTTFLEGDASKEGGKGVVGFEWNPVWGPPGLREREYYVPKFYSLGWGAGVGYRIDEVLSGFDGTARVYVLWPKIDMHASAGVRVAHLTWAGNQTTRVVPEVRIAKTLGFVGFFLGATQDFRLLESGEINQTLGLQTGIQLAIPWWRTARWTTNLFHPVHEGL